MRQQSFLIPPSPSEESVPDTVNASVERSADTVSLRMSAQFRNEVEVVSRGLDALGRRPEGVRRPSSDPILYGGACMNLDEPIRAFHQSPVSTAASVSVSTERRSRSMLRYARAFTLGLTIEWE